MHKAQELVAQGYYQVSRRYRLVARLPPGYTGRKALREKNPKLASEMSEAHCRDHFLRVYAEHLELDAETFVAFRVLRNAAPSTMDDVLDLQRELHKHLLRWPELDGLIGPWINQLDEKLV